MPSFLRQASGAAQQGNGVRCGASPCLRESRFVPSAARAAESGESPGSLRPIPPASAVVDIPSSERQSRADSAAALAQALVSRPNLRNCGFSRS